MVAETATSAQYVPGYPGQMMMAKEVYASVVWALVMATIASPLMFRWALGVYGRATPIVRSRTISNRRQLKKQGTAAAEGEGTKETLSHSFVIRIAAKHHTGVQREILGCLHGSGVDVLEANVLGVNDPTTAELDAFVATYTVASRGAKKDFDDEKLEEMKHQLDEILDDEDAQVFFEPYDDDFSNDGVIEIQVMVQHHPDILHELTDALASMGLDVLKVDATHTSQPTHGNTTKGGEDSSVHKGSALMRAPSSGNLKRQGSWGDMLRHSGTSRDSSPALQRADQSLEAAAALDRVSRSSQEARDRVSAIGAAFTDGVEFFTLEEKERVVFYATEVDGTHQFSASRRAEIKKTLEQIVTDHNLHGTILVRVVHQKDMALAHQVPKFDHEDRIVVVRSQGEHHVDLLHEICDMIHESKLDVVHAEMDTNSKGVEEHALYVSRTDNRPTTREQRTELRTKVQGLYRKHNKASDATVSVLPLRNEDEESLLGGQASPGRGEGRRMSRDHPLAGRTKADRISPPVSPKTQTAEGGAPGGAFPPSLEAIPVATTAASTSTSATFASSVSSSVALEAVTVETPRDETDLEQEVLARAPTPADQV